MTALAQALNHLADAQPFQASWYLKDLAGATTLGRDAELPVATRSTRKVAIMMALLSAVASGEFELSRQIRIPEAYQRTRSGVTQYFLPDPVLRLHDAMTLMIGVSDNGCTGAIVDLLGLDRLNAYCRSIGMDHTVHRSALPLATSDLQANTVSTPGEQGRLLEAILEGADDPVAARRLGCAPLHCALALRAMRSQQLRGKIPALLPEEATVAHKDGTGPGMHHDTGIVYRGETPLYVLCAYTWNVPAALESGDSGRAAASRFIAQLSRAAWDAWAGR